MLTFDVGVVVLVLVSWCWCLGVGVLVLVSWCWCLGVRVRVLALTLTLLVVGGAAPRGGAVDDRSRPTLASTANEN